MNRRQEAGIVIIVMAIVVVFRAFQNGNVPEELPAMIGYFIGIGIFALIGVLLFIYGSRGSDKKKNKK